jgi:hypothetical protein
MDVASSLARRNVCLYEERLLVLNSKKKRQCKRLKVDSKLRSSAAVQVLWMLKESGGAEVRLTSARDRHSLCPCWHVAAFTSTRLYLVRTDLNCCYNSHAKQAL